MKQSQEINKNPLKTHILNCLILLVANKKEINRLAYSNPSDKYYLSNYFLVNKSWVDTFKATFYYNEIQNILLQSNFHFNTYNDYVRNLNYFISVSEIQKIISRIMGIPDIISNQIKYLSVKSIHQKYSDIIYPNDFELINDSLVNLFKFLIDMKSEINNYQLEYKIYIGNNILYLQSKDNPKIFYVYLFDNKSYIFMAFIKFQDNLLFKEELNIFFKKNFIQYIYEKKCDINNEKKINVLYIKIEHKIIKNI